MRWVNDEKMFSFALTIPCVPTSYFCGWTVWLCWSMLVFSAEACVHMCIWITFVLCVYFLGEKECAVVEDKHRTWFLDFSVYLPGSTLHRFARSNLTEVFWVKESWFHALMDLDASKKNNVLIERKKMKKKRRKRNVKLRVSILWKNRSGLFATELHAITGIKLTNGDYTWLISIFPVFTYITIKKCGVGNIFLMLLKECSPRLPF